MMRQSGRWWISAGLALFAGLATVSGLDRSTEQQPAAARFIPQVFSSHAARAAAAQALAEGDIANARKSARQAIDADPLDRRGPAYLAAAQALGGADAEAAGAFALSNALSRREPVTQSYLYGTAMKRGDYRAAARQVDILLRAHPEFPAARRFLSELEETPAGHAGLLDRLVRDPAWAKAYFEGYGMNDAALRKRAATLAQTVGGGGLGCERAIPLVRALERRDLRREARELHDAQCFGLANVGAMANPVGLFGEAGWRRHPAGDVRIGAGAPITLASRASVTRLMLSRAVALEPGEYRAYAKVDGAGAERVAASLNCGAAERPRRGGVPLGRGQILRAVICEDLVIGIWLRPGAGTVTIDGFRIEPVEPQPQSRP